VEDFSLFN